VSAVAAAPQRSPGARKEVGTAGGSPKGGEGVLVERLVQSLEDCVRRSQDASSMLSRLTQQNEEVAREIRSVEEDKQLCAERVERAEERTAVASDELDRLRASLAPAAASMARLHALRNERFLLTQALVATDRDRRRTCRSGGAWGFGGEGW
jgi:chromosome segregation ATPase